MTLSWNRSLKTGLATAGAAATFAVMIPGTASADIVDDALGAIPAGQISCDQANQYWTTESEYNSYANQARAVAAFHPRGGEINDALVRIDEAADRCGLKGGATAAPEQNAGGQNTAPLPADNTASNTGGDAPGGNTGDTDDQGADNQNTAQAPAGNGAEAAPAPTGPVFTIPVPAGIPTINIPIADVATVVGPDVEKLIADAQNGNALAQLAVGSSN